MIYNLIPSEILDMQGEHFYLLARQDKNCFVIEYSNERTTLILCEVVHESITKDDCLTLQRVFKELSTKPLIFKFGDDQIKIDEIIRRLELHYENRSITGVT